MHILEWSFIVSSLRHTCAIIMLPNHHLDMPHLWGGWLSRSLTQIYTDLWTIFERNRPFVYIEQVLDLSSAREKWGKNKSVEFIILFSVCIYIHGCAHKFTCPLQNMQNVNNFNKIRGIMKIACYFYLVLSWISYFT